jgi:hypothetical protein
MVNKKAPQYQSPRSYSDGLLVAISVVFSGGVRSKSRFRCFSNSITGKLEGYQGEKEAVYIIKSRNRNRIREGATT